MASRSGRDGTSIWQKLWGSGVNVWASLSRRDRVGVIVGTGLLLSSACMAVDSRLLRHEEYRQWWIDRENQKYAEQLDMLLMPGNQSRGQKQDN